MRFFYSLGIDIYTSVIFIAALFSRKANLMIKGRMDSKLPDFGSDHVIWIHAASLGEFEQGKPLIEKLKKDYSKTKIVLTFFSPSGYEVRKNYELVNYVTYIPFDSKKNAIKFLDKLKPNLVVFIKYEFWFNFLIELKRRKIPVVFISSIFRENQIYFKPIGKWFLKHLLQVTHFFVQNKHSQEVLIRNNINQNTVTGDTRFDSVLDVKNTNFKNPKIDSFLSGSKCIVFGSTWRPDEEFIIKFINSEILKGFKFIIAPHEISHQKKRANSEEHQSSIRTIL
jgi:3-deoxy-D-manno-octulosonic-acid transferase